MKFRHKLLLCMIWLLTLSYGIGGTVLIEQSFQSGLAEKKESAAASYQMTLQTVSLIGTIDLQQSLSTVSAALSKMEASSDWSSVWLQKGNSTIYKSGEAFTALSPEKKPLQAIFSYEDNHFIQISSKLLTDEAALHLDIVYPIESVYHTRLVQTQTYRRVLLLLLVIGSVLSLLLSYFLTRPLFHISKASRRLASGEMTARARVQGQDEISLLATEFNRMAERLEASIRQLQDTAQQQEAFIGSFAHETKTPMTSIIGYADLLRGQSLTEEEQREAANYIFSEGKRLEALSMKLLELLTVKNQVPHLQRTEMSALVQGMVQHLQPIYEASGIVLQAKCEQGFCMVEPDLMKSLIYNLIDNARKAMTDNGNIYLVTDRLEGQYRIRVVDNGCGMPQEAIAHLTEAFYRVDKSRSRKLGGAGLGLTLCSRIVEVHHGQLSIESRQSKGTCVSILLQEAAL